MRLVNLSVAVSVCLSVCLCTRINEDMHSNERFLVRGYLTLTPSFEENPITQGHEILSIRTRVLAASHNEDFVILGVTVLMQCQGVTDGRTDKRTDTSTMAKTREALHAVARKNGTRCG